MDILAGIADNQPLYDEVKALLVKHFMSDDARTEGLSDERLGQMYRARLIGLEKIESAFMEIAKHKTYQKKERGINPAR